MSAIAGINGDVHVTAAPSVTLGASPETCTDQGDHIHYWTNTHQFWDPTHPVSVQYSANGTTGWTAEPAANYVFHYAVGEIVFANARSVGVNNYIRLSAGYYFTDTQLSGASSWKLSMQGNIKDVTPFQATGGWAVNTGTTKSANGSIDVFAQDDQLLKELNNTSNALIGLQLWFYETGGQRWQCFANVATIQQTVDDKDVEKQTINFTVYGPLYFVTSNSLSSTTVKIE